VAPSFKQRDLTRVIKAAQAAGLTVSQIKFVNGEPIIIFGDESRQNDDANEWDKAMIAELGGHQ
jgi:hypothetical protein